MPEAWLELFQLRALVLRQAMLANRHDTARGEQRRERLRPAWRNKCIEGHAASPSIECRIEACHEALRTASGNSFPVASW
jgi:hypothetical protein